MVDCDAPLASSGVVTDPFSDTTFGALITFHCEGSKKSMTSMCGSNGEWDPDPNTLHCGNGRH